MKNWKTTLSGILFPIGMYLQNIEDPIWLNVLGQIITSVSVLYLGYKGNDFVNKSIPGEGTKG